MDFKIEVLVKDVARGDLETITDALDELGPDFDASRGDFQVRILERRDERSPWFQVEDEVDD
jgi:hypothetical protein